MIQNTLGIWKPISGIQNSFRMRNSREVSCLNVAHPDAYTFLESILKEDVKLLSQPRFIWHVMNLMMLE